MDPPQKNNPLLKNEVPFSEIIPRKKKNSKYKNLPLIYVSLIKQQRAKFAVIPEKTLVPTWSIQSFIRKVKQLQNTSYIISAFMLL